MYTRIFAVSLGSVALVVALMLLPGTASADAIPSDILTVTFDGVTITRTLTEVAGESVTDEIAFSGATGFSPGPDSVVFLVQPGTIDPETGLSIQSDKVTLHVSGEQGVTLHFTLGSDEDPGRSNFVSGIVETGTLQNITALLVPDLHGHTITVLVQSDANPDPLPLPTPEPASLLLLGSGLAGLGFWGQKLRRDVQA
jgi:hypothetical protein